VATASPVRPRIDGLVRGAPKLPNNLLNQRVNWQALPSGSHAEWPVQGSRRQEYWAADARGFRAQQAGKLEARALFAASQVGTVAPAGGNACAPRLVRFDLVFDGR
jgi:hypothetical protein